MSVLQLQLLSISPTFVLHSSREVSVFLGDKRKQGRSNNKIVHKILKKLIKVVHLAARVFGLPH